MMQLTTLELCAGYNGLGMAVEHVFGARTIGFAEFDAAPSAILAYHYPGIPNHGDMTRIDWAGLERPGIISGGTPCQDLSAAGRRAGMSEGTRSNLWVQMREAIAVHRPAFVVWENVRGAFSARADSSLEFCPRCMGSPVDSRVVLRALGRVLGDLSDLGYDCQWRGLRAADVGACHPRFRVFVLAALRHPDREDVERLGAARLGLPPMADGARQRRSPGAAPENPDLAAGRERRLPAPPGQAEGGRAWADPRGRGRAPAADAGGDGRLRRPDHQGEGRIPGIGSEEVDHASDGRAPRPAADPQSRGRDARTPAPPGRGPEPARGRGRREPAPDTQGLGRGEGRAEPERLQRGSDAPLGGHQDWGKYAPAIRRWETITRRPAPRPTEPTGRAGGHRLSPYFTEWMMGLPAGWVTDPAIGLTPNQQLKVCGDGVVPQQAAAALTHMLHAHTGRAS